MNAASFTYDYYVRILDNVKEKYDLRLLRDGLAGNTARPQLFLRHDVDVSIPIALAMAQIEAEHGVHATYMFLPRSRLYDVRRDRVLLRRLIQLEHEVALHFDVHEHARSRHATIDDVLADIERDCQIISDITGEPVSSVSFHCPMPQFLKGELTIAGRTNAYSTALMQSYISDSKGCWRQGEPVAYLQTAAGPVVQLLVHPIWWSVRHLEPRQRLEKLYLKATAGLTSAASARYDAALALTLPSVRRSNHMAA